jgi:hypothetical protein
MWPTRFASLLGLPGYDRNGWGGPTFAGVWAVHAAGGLAVLFAMPWMLRGLTQLHARLLGRKASVGAVERRPGAGLGARYRLPAHDPTAAQRLMES